MGWFDWDDKVDTWARDVLRRKCDHQGVYPDGKYASVPLRYFNLVDIIGKKLRLRFLLPKHEVDGVEYGDTTEILACVNTCEVHRSGKGGGQILLHIAPLRVMTKSNQTNTLLAIAFQSTDSSEACQLVSKWEKDLPKEDGKFYLNEVAIMWD